MEKLTRNESQKLRYKTDPEYRAKVLAIAKKWRDNNKEYRRANAKEYWKKYAEKNKEKIIYRLKVYNEKATTKKKESYKYTLKIDEVWDNLTSDEYLYQYQISQYGGVRYFIDGDMKYLKPLFDYVKSRGKKYNYWTVSLKRKDGTKTKKMIHTLVANAFLDRKENQRRVTFIDGNINNYHFKNLCFTNKTNTPVYKSHWDVYKDRIDDYKKGIRKRKTFTSDKQEMIRIIQGNTTPKNKEINSCLIDFLNGKENRIEFVYKKYYTLWQSVVDVKRRDLNKNFRKGKQRENSITIHDVMQEGFIFMLDKLRTGRFDGKNFKSWSTVVMRNFFVHYMRKNAEENLIFQRQF